MVKNFRDKILPFFTSASAAGPQYVNFGSSFDNVSKCNIKRGVLTLLASEVASFFESSIDYIVKTAIKQEQVIKGKISHVVVLHPHTLPNGWMTDKIYSRLSANGMHVVSLDDYPHGPELLNSAILSYMDLTHMERKMRAQEDGYDGEILQVPVTIAQELDGRDGS